MDASPRRPIGDVLATGVLTGLIAGFAAGLIDAVWSWAPAAQFVPGALLRLRFVLYSGLTLGTAGAFVGLVLASGLLVMSRFTRVGDLVRFGWAEHLARRARDPREAVIGLSFVLAGVPLVDAAIYVVYRMMTPVVVKSHALGLATLVVIVATLVGLGIAVVLMFVLARVVEDGLRALAPRLPIIASPWAPLVAAGLLVGAAVVEWLHRLWDVARVLPLRGPLVVVVAAVLAIPASGPARRSVLRVNELRPGLRRYVWAALPVMLLGLVGLVLLTGGNASVIKAATAYTGLGKPIARGVRKVFDRDRDGFSRVLGGGDCDDGNAAIHPGAAEVPDDGIDQNCVGGDASSKQPPHDVGFAPVPASVPQGANILLVTIDTARADHFGMYGYKRPTSPALDKLAAEGTVFEAGWAHAPSTRYSMPAILTGRLPLEVYYNHAIAGWPGLLPKATTLCEALAPLGYITGAITNYEYFDRSRAMDQGCSEYDNENQRLHSRVTGAGPEQTSGSSAKEQTDKAIAFVDRHAAQKWFLWVHYYDPHYAYQPHPGVSFGIDRKALYDGEIRFTDTQIARLLDKLRAAGVYDKTIVVVTGDHGEGFGEHNIDLHGYHLYAPQTKVPFVIRVPGLPPRRSRTAAGHVDIMPTLVNLAGGQPNGDMMGTSLVAPLAGTDQVRTVVQELSYEGNNEMRGAADARCHVIYNVSPETSWEVYRVDRDPLETEDVSGDDGECRDTRRAFERWYDAGTVPAGAAEALLPVRPAITAPLDASFGSEVRLLAVEVPPTAKPGDTMTITWTFEARGTVGADWKLFVHVKGPGSQPFINGDHKPARPFEWWRAGQFIRYSTTITLPRFAQQGTYTVWVGMFRGKDRKPVHAPQAKIDNNALAAATFEVTP